jgi:hypothetical protein
MVQNTTDRANIDDDISNCAKLIGRSKHRRSVFAEIYRGKKEWKTVAEIAKEVRLKPKRVLEEAKRFVSHKYVNQKKIEGETAYSKDPTLNLHKAKILSAAGNKAKFAKLPTRSRPHASGGVTVSIQLKRSDPKPSKITVDDVQSFRLVRNINGIDRNLKLGGIREERIKAGFKKILGETHDFKDWGGEKNDLYTSKFYLGSSRKDAAFAFKGRATSGTLTPKKMGANGDQVARLFASDADVFFIVYHGKVDESIHVQMRAHALALSLGGKSVTYGVIDGDDLNRLYRAYRKCF